MLENEEHVNRVYIPMEYRVRGGHTQLTPAINNILFVNITYKGLKEIRNNHYLYEPLRYIMHPVFGKNGETKEILYVPDQMMHTFIRVTEERQSNVIFLKNLDFACRPGMKAQITEGHFCGVVGVVKHIKRSLCLVIPIQRVAAAAIIQVPRHHLRYISDEEYLEFNR